MDLALTELGGFALTGFTHSYSIYSHDVFLSVFDNAANHLWSRSFELGDSGTDAGTSVIQTGDGGFAVTGKTSSAGAGNYDVFLSKFDGTGAHLWSRVFGGTNMDTASAVIETSDGGLIVTGVTQSYGPGSRNVLLSKFNGTGTHLWTKVYGQGSEEARGVIETEDGDLVVIGNTLWCPQLGQTDVLLARFDDMGNTCIEGDSVIPEIEIVTPTVQDITPPVATTSSMTVNDQSPTVDDPEYGTYWVCPLCGDPNDDGDVTTSDGYMILNYFGADVQPASCWTANVNGDGNLTTADGFHLLNYFGDPETFPLMCSACEF
jgi:hypothetical protein